MGTCPWGLRLRAETRTQRRRAARKVKGCCYVDKRFSQRGERPACTRAPNPQAHRPSRLTHTCRQQRGGAARLQKGETRCCKWLPWSPGCSSHQGSRSPALPGGLQFSSGQEAERCWQSRDRRGEGLHLAPSVTVHFIPQILLILPARSLWGHYKITSKKELVFFLGFRF